MLFACPPFVHLTQSDDSLLGDPSRVEHVSPGGRVQGERCSLSIGHDQRPPYVLLVQRKQPKQRQITRFWVAEDGLFGPEMTG